MIGNNSMPLTSADMSHPDAFLEFQSLNLKVGFFEVVTPLGGARIFICASESCFGSHAFVSGQFTAKIMLFPVISGFMPKSESKWGLPRANTTPRDERRGDNFKKSDFTLPGLSDL
eukprot:sb/3476583/